MRAFERWRQERRREHRRLAARRERRRQDLRLIGWRPPTWVVVGYWTAAILFILGITGLLIAQHLR